MEYRIGVLTSGGDAPGMNATIRSVVRAGIAKGMRVVGIRHGYQGLVDGDLVALDHHAVSNVIQRGGTILGTARSQAFEKAAGMRKAHRTMRRAHLDALVVIGGEGTMRGADEFAHAHGEHLVGLPGTIDNDLYGTDYTIGFDTAVNSAMDAVDRIRDTASSLERVFFIEVMGRKAGFISLAVGLAGGAEEVLIPETKTSIPGIARIIKQNLRKGKRSNIVIVAEGDECGNAMQIADQVKRLTGEEYRVAVLGYIQRGGSPTAADRVLASRLGYHAVEALAAEHHGCLIGEVNGMIVRTPFSETYTRKKAVDRQLYRIIKILAGEKD